MPAEVAVKQGETAILQVAPGVWSRYQGRECHVTRVDDYGSIVLADVEFRDPGSADDLSVVVPGVPVQYLVPVRDAKPRRRSPLNLAMPKDERPEKEKMEEGISALREMGYTVLTLGQFQAQSVCWRCTSAQRRENPNAKPVKIFCPNCHKPVFNGGGFGNTPGAPDSLVTFPYRWGFGAGLLMEWKEQEKAERTKEQKIFERDGVIVVVWSLTTCLRMVHWYEKKVLRIEPLPSLEEWLQAHQERQEAA